MNIINDKSPTQKKMNITQGQKPNTKPDRKKAQPRINVTGEPVCDKSYKPYLKSRF